MIFNFLAAVSLLTSLVATCIWFGSVFIWSDRLLYLEHNPQYVLGLASGNLFLYRYCPYEGVLLVPLSLVILITALFPRLLRRWSPMSRECGTVIRRSEGVAGEMCNGDTNSGA